MSDEHFPPYIIILLYFPWFCTVISLAYNQIRHPQENRSIAMIYGKTYLLLQDKK